MIDAGSGRSTARGDAAQDDWPSAPADGEQYAFPCLEPWQATGAPTFDAVYREILCDHGCASPYCHGSRAESGGLTMENLDVAYTLLVDVLPGPRSLCEPQGLPRVAPGQPERSLLYLKVAGQAPCGADMPPSESNRPRLSEAALAQLRTWIELGALPHD